MSIINTEEVSVDTMYAHLSSVVEQCRCFKLLIDGQESQQKSVLMNDALVLLLFAIVDSIQNYYQSSLKRQEIQENKKQELLKQNQSKRSITDLYSEKYTEQINDLQAKLQKSQQEIYKLQSQALYLQERYDFLVRDSKKETFPKLETFCTEMNKFLNLSEAENSKQMQQLFAFENLLNFNDPFKNKFMLKERLKKPKEMQTEDEYDKIPKQITEYFEQDKLEIGRPEVKCLFQYFDVQILRVYKKDRTLDKIAFTDKINHLIIAYSQNKKYDNFRDFTVHNLMQSSARDKFLSDLMFIVHTSYQCGDTKSRQSGNGNVFLSRIFNHLIEINNHKVQSSYLHGKLFCTFMNELQRIKREFEDDYLISSDYDKAKFFTYNNLMLALKQSISNLSIKPASYQQTLIGNFFEYLIIFESFNKFSGDQNQYYENETFLNIDQQIINLNQHKSKLTIIMKDKVRAFIEQNHQISRQRSLRKKRSQASSFDLTGTFDRQETINIANMNFGNMVEHENELQILNTYYDLLMIKIMVYDEQNMPRTIRRMFTQYGTKEKINKASMRNLLETQFEGYITQFEIEFLLHYLPFSQIDKGSLNEVERAKVMRYLQNQTSLADQSKSDRIYYLRHFQKELLNIEQMKIVANEYSNKLRVFNSFILALNNDGRHYALERFNEYFQKYDNSNYPGSQGEHCMHEYKHFKEFLVDYIMNGGGHLQEKSEDEQEQIITNLYIQMCHSHRFNYANKSQFDRNALIELLVEERIFTGFEIIKEVVSPTLMVKKLRSHKLIKREFITKQSHQEND